MEVCGLKSLTDSGSSKIWAFVEKRGAMTVKGPGRMIREKDGRGCAQGKSRYLE